MEDLAQRRAKIFSASNAYLLPTFLLLLAFLFGSYLHVSEPTQNDFERLRDARLLVFFFLCFLGWCCCYAALADAAFLRRHPADWRGARMYIGLAVLVFPLLLSFPVGSRDVFAYAFYGKMWGHYGVDPFFHAPTEFQEDAWYPLLQAWWKEGAAGYGPFFLLQTRLVYALCGDNLIATVATYKLLNLALLCAGVVGLSVLTRDNVDQPRFGHDGLVLWAWSPLILFEGIASAHNDLTVAVTLVAAFLFWLRRRWWISGCLWAFTFWYKWYTVIVLPAFLLWSLKREPAWSPAFVGLLRAVAGALLVTTCALLPFAQNASTILLKPLGVKVGQALFPTELPPTLWPIFYLYLESGWFDLQRGRELFEITRYSFAAFCFAWVLLRRWNDAYAPNRAAEDCFYLLLIFNGFITTVLWPWHLMATCTFGLLSETDASRWIAVALMIVGMLSYFLTFSIAALAVLLATAALAFLRRRRT
ncbi:MAG: hypothetical protein N3C12_13305 [Candidatus Binatia bacterium]|nr:hypothetical protein [Candidatus Binatia bacterium]